MPLNIGKGKHKNRSRLEIVRDILSFALVKARKTKIMYRASLNYVQLEKYLNNLLENGLLEHDGDSHYLTTENGRKFLKIYNNHFNRCKRIEKEADEVAIEDQILESMCFNKKDFDKRKVTPEEALL